jgi:Transposase DNA-binding
MEAAVNGWSETTSGSFGKEHFENCQFGDKRLTDRAVRTADALLAHPAGTLPGKLRKAELLGYYDFVNNQKVEHETVLAGHYQRTRGLMEQCPGTVLVIHDTTEADYSGLAIAELGPIGNGSCQGLLVHNVLAMDYQNREALGLIGQFIHRRRKVKKKETPAQKRQDPQRESRLWLKGVEVVGQGPADLKWVNLMDRGGDTFESLERQLNLGQGLIVRSKSNRNVQVLDQAGRRIRRKLHDWARKLPGLGRRTVQVQANSTQSGREAIVEVASARVWLLPPDRKRGEHGDEPLELQVVRVSEVQARAGVEPLEWILLTNLPAQGRKSAWQVVDYYQCRPIIEELHKAQKTGCGMEQVQFTTRRALENTIALVSVVAVQLLRLRDLGRRADANSRAASEVVDEIYVQVLSLWRFKAARALSVWEFLFALGRLGGHLNRKQDRPPGWLVLWRGWMELQRLVEGAQLMQLKRCG